MNSYLETLSKLGLDVAELEKNRFQCLNKLPSRSDGMFSQAYSHCFYSGLSNDEIKRLEEIIQRKLPEELIELFKISNGFSLFYSSLSVRGLLRENSRNPITLEYGTILDRPMKDGEFLDNSDEIRFGAYGHEHTDLMIRLTGGEIKAVKRFETSENVLKVWPSLTDFLASEVDRMLAYRDDIDPLNPIPPNYS